LENTEKKTPAMMPDLILMETTIEEAKGWDFIVQYFQKWGRVTHQFVKLVTLTSSQFFSDFYSDSHFVCVSVFFIKPLSN